MQRIIADGTEQYALLVDRADGQAGGDRAGQIPAHETVSFGDEAECLMFLKRVADDYSERAALREIYAGWSSREDLYRISDEQLQRRLAQLIVAGHIELRKL